MASTNDLMKAALEGDVTKVQGLLAAGVDPNRLGRQGDTPLFVAAQNGHLEVCRALLDAGANPNFCDAAGNTVLICAVGHKQDLVVKLLLERGADVNQRGYRGRTALFNAVAGSDTKIAQALIDAGADLFVKDQDDNSVLSEAAAYGGKRMQKFIKQITQTRAPTANVDLHQAGADGLLDQLQRHLQGGKDVNRRDRFGRTALMAAAREGQLPAVEALLAAGADPHAVSPRGDHALHDAAISGKADVIRRLLQAGVDVNTTVEKGLTALMMAALFGHIETMQCLLDLGADPRLKTGDGKTALDMAKSHRKAHQFLKQTLGIGPDAADALRDEVKALKTRAAEPAFEEVLQRLAKQCGHEPYPWKKRKGVFRFWIRDRSRLAAELGLPATAKREELIPILQEEVRAAGFLLVIGDSLAPNPPLMLFPTSNSYAVVLACGTNGNRLVQVNATPTFMDAAIIAAWLRDMEQTHPWIVTECGFDFVGGRFLGPVKDANQLAARMIDFCPDLVDGESVRGVEDVAGHLATDRSFFFWWD